MRPSLLFFLVLALAGCADRALDAPQLGPAEQFDWASQPIAFSPPPESWERGPYQQGGLNGVDFIHRGSVGERIAVTEYYRVGDRDRRAVLQDIVDRFDSYSSRELLSALQKARAQTQKLYTAHEGEVARRINDALRRAELAQRQQRGEEARTQIGVALSAARQLHFDIGDVVGDAIFDPSGWDEPERFTVLDTLDLNVGGSPARAVNYTWESPERTYRGREVYVLRDNHLFVAKFHGLDKHFALFNRVVASITFPGWREGQSP